MEEILGDDGQTVSSLVVRFTLPEHVKNADDGIQLLFEPDAAYTGGALAVKSADANGELQQRCRVILPITVDQDGTQAKFRKKMPVKRDPSVTITTKSPSSAGCAPGGLGAMGATAPDRDTECLCVPSPTPPDDTSTKVPPSLPRAHGTQLGEAGDPSESEPIYAGLDSSALRMDRSPPPASHDTGRPKSQASGPTDQLDKWEQSECCPHMGDREFVTAQGAATGSAISGTDMCPDLALCKPKTPPARRMNLQSPPTIART